MFDKIVHNSLITKVINIPKIFNLLKSTLIISLIILTVNWKMFRLTDR